MKRFGHRWSESVTRCVRRSLLLDNDSALIAPLVGYLQRETLLATGCTAEEAARVGLALEEALTNALFHGNLELNTKLRREGDDAYFALARKRASQAPFRERRTRVEAQLFSGEARFTIRDEGPGFDPSLLVAPTAAAALEQIGGRGIFLMRCLMDRVVFNQRGNQVTLVKRFRREADPSSAQTREVTAHDELAEPEPAECGRLLAV